MSRATLAAPAPYVSEQPPTLPPQAGTLTTLALEEGVFVLRHDNRTLGLIQRRDVALPPLFRAVSIGGALSHHATLWAAADALAADAGIPLQRVHLAIQWS